MALMHVHVVVVVVVVQAPISVFQQVLDGPLLTVALIAGAHKCISIVVVIEVQAQSVIVLASYITMFSDVTHRYLKIGEHPFGNFRAADSRSRLDEAHIQRQEHSKKSEVCFSKQRILPTYSSRTAAETRGAHLA